MAAVPHCDHHPRQWVLALPATWRPRQPSQPHSFCKDTIRDLSIASHLCCISFAYRRAERLVSSPPSPRALLGACLSPCPFFLSPPLLPLLPPSKSLPSSGPWGQTAISTAQAATAGPRGRPGPPACHSGCCQKSQV